MEVLLHSGTKISAWRTAQIHQAILAAFGLKASNYTLTQLRYDIRKMKAHGLIERDGKRYAYRLTPKGNKVALLFVLFHKRVCGPLANSLFNSAPQAEPKPATRIEAAYRKADQSISTGSRSSRRLIYVREKSSDQKLKNLRRTGRIHRCSHNIETISAARWV